MTTLRQVEKVLRKAGVKYQRHNTCILMFNHGKVHSCISGKDSVEYVLCEKDGEAIITFKFNSLTSDKESLYFSYKGESPLIVNIK